MNRPASDVQVGDLAQFRKPHPCGGDTWAVVRVGGEIGLVCQTCQRKIFLPRSEFERRLKQLQAHD